MISPQTRPYLSLHQQHTHSHRSPNIQRPLCRRHRHSNHVPQHQHHQQLVTKPPQPTWRVLHRKRPKIGHEQVSSHHVHPKKNIPLPNLTLSNRELGWAPEIIYLGVTIDKTRTFRRNIKNINSKAIEKIKAIQYLLIHHGITLKSKTLLYTSLVKPVMTYASPAWCIISKAQLNRLQKALNYALRLITRSLRYIPIAALHNNANISTIEEHLHHLNTSFYLKLKSDPNINPTLIPSLTIRMMQTRKKRRTTLECLRVQTSKGPRRPRHWTIRQIQTVRRYRVGGRHDKHEDNIDMASGELLEQPSGR